MNHNPFFLANLPPQFNFKPINLYFITPVPKIEK